MVSKKLRGILEIVEEIEFADDTAQKLLGLIDAYKAANPQYARHPGFKELLGALEDAAVCHVDPESVE